jgi:hypothetical protein
MPQSLEHSLAACSARLLCRGERRLLLLTGTALACQQQATTLWQPGALWLGDGPVECAPQKSQHTMPWLGQEYPLVVVNGFSIVNQKGGTGKSACTAKLAVHADFPVPPFWFTIEITFAIIFPFFLVK